MERTIDNPGKADTMVSKECKSVQGRRRSSRNNGTSIKFKWISYDDAKVLEGGDVIEWWKATEITRSKEMKTNAPHKEKPILEYLNGDMYFGQLKEIQSNGSKPRWKEHGKGIKCNKRTGQYYVGSFQDGKRDSCGRASWLINSRTWRENNDKNSQIRERVAGRKGLPFEYDGKYIDDKKHCINAKVTLKNGTEKVGPWLAGVAVTKERFNKERGGVVTAVKDGADWWTVHVDEDTDTLFSSPSSRSELVRQRKFELYRDDNKRKDDKNNIGSSKSVCETNVTSRNNPISDDNTIGTNRRRKQPKLPIKSIPFVANSKHSERGCVSSSSSKFTSCSFQGPTSTLASSPLLKKRFSNNKSTAGIKRMVHAKQKKSCKVARQQQRVVRDNDGNNKERRVDDDAEDDDDGSGVICHDHENTDDSSDDEAIIAAVARNTAAATRDSAPALQRKTNEKKRKRNDDDDDDNTSSASASSSTVVQDRSIAITTITTTTAGDYDSEESESESISNENSENIENSDKIVVERRDNTYHDNKTQPRSGQKRQYNSHESISDVVTRETPSICFSEVTEQIYEIQEPHVELDERTYIGIHTGADNNGAEWYIRGKLQTICVEQSHVPPLIITGDKVTYTRKSNGEFKILSREFFIDRKKLPRERKDANEAIAKEAEINHARSLQNKRLQETRPLRPLQWIVVDGGNYDDDNGDYAEKNFKEGILIQYTRGEESKIKVQFQGQNGKKIHKYFPLDTLRPFCPVDMESFWNKVNVDQTFCSGTTFSEDPAYLYNRWRSKKDDRTEADFDSISKTRARFRRSINKSENGNNLTEDGLLKIEKRCRTLLQRLQVDYKSSIDDPIENSEEFYSFKNRICELKLLLPSINVLLLCGGFAPDITAYKRCGIPLGMVVIQDIDLHAVGVAVAAHPVSFFCSKFVPGGAHACEMRT